MNSLRSFCFTTFAVVMLCCLFMIAPQGYAQAPDTVVVEPGTPGAIEQALADNPGKVLKLRRNGIYILTETLSADTALVLYGEPSPTADPPATLVRSAEEGEGPSVIDTNNDLKLQNIAVLGWTLQGTGINFVIRLRNKDGGNYEFYNCYFERTTNRITRFDAPNQRIIARDNIFMNIGNINNWQGGFCFQFQGALPREVIIQNNTIINVGSVFITHFRGEINGNFTIDHNTFVLGNREYFTPNDEYFNATIKNNIFYNPFSRGHSGVQVNANGDTTYFGDFVDQETDSPNDTIQAFISFDDSLAPELRADLGISEDERNVLVTQNVLFREQRFLDWYEENNWTEQPFLTERSRAAVDRNPSITVDEPINMDPGFVRQLPDSVYENYMEWVEGFRTAEAFKPPDFENPDRYWYGDGNPDLPFAWPIRPKDGHNALLDLSYSTSSPLFTAGTDGLPLGDLNWFPDIATSVEDPDGDNVPTTFELEQNFPNPFNPETKIRYSLSSSAEVSLSIYNVLGQKIRTLINDKQPSGQHSIVWDARNDSGQPVASGIYVYRLETGDRLESKKMLLLR